MMEHSWHSDPVFPADDLEHDRTLQRTPEISFHSPQSSRRANSPAGMMSSSKKNRSFSSRSETSLKDINKSSANGKRPSIVTYTTKDVDNTISRLQKENIQWRTKFSLLMQKYEVALGDEDESKRLEEIIKAINECFRDMPTDPENDDGFFSYMKVIQEKDEELQHMKDSLEDKYRKGYQDCLDDIKTKQLESPSPSLTCRTIEDSPFRLNDFSKSPFTFEEKSPIPRDELKKKLEGARLAGYQEACEELGRCSLGRSLNRPGLETNVSDGSAQTSFLAIGNVFSVENSDNKSQKISKNPETSCKDSTGFDSTHYQELPSHIGLSCPIAQSSPIIRPTESNPINPIPELLLARDSLPPVLHGKVKVSSLEKCTFHLLIKRLQELVEFLSRGLEGNLDVSDISMNLSLMLNASLDISYSVNLDDGDGSHAEFNLHGKLQEIINMSREISFHNVEVEADEQWKALSDEKEELVLKLTNLTEELQVAQKAVSSAVEENEKLVERLNKATAENQSKVHLLEQERDGLEAELERMETEKSRLEEELSEMLERISTFEEEMQQTKANQEFLRQNLVPRPTCDISCSTEIDTTMEDLHTKMAKHEEENLRMQNECDSLIKQVEYLRNIKEDLETRLDDCLSIISDMEKLQNDNTKHKEDIEKLQAGIAVHLEEIESLKKNKMQIAQELVELEAARQQISAEFNAFRAGKEVEREQTDGKICRLEDELTSATTARQHVVDELHRIQLEAQVMEMRLKDTEVALEEREHRLAHLQECVNVLRTPAEKSEFSQQTDLTWAEMKADKARQLSMMEQLMDHADRLETELRTTKDSCDATLNESQQSRLLMAEKLDKLITETDNVLHEKDVLETKIMELVSQLHDTEKKLRESEDERNVLAANQENLRAKEEQIAKWEKAVRKQIGKTQKVIDQANQNMADIIRTKSKQPAPSHHPLTERHSLPHRPNNS